MKTLLLCAAALGLTGCAVYPAGTYDAGGTYGNYGGYGGYGGYGYESAPVVVNPSPVYIYGSGVYRSGSHQGSRPYRGDRDRDRDGVPNRVDRDRDGDGVPNRRDSRPNNPNYR